MSILLGEVQYIQGANNLVNYQTRYWYSLRKNYKHLSKPSRYIKTKNVLLYKYRSNYKTCTARATRRPRFGYVFSPRPALRGFTTRNIILYAWNVFGRNIIIILNRFDPARHSIRLVVVPPPSAPRYHYLGM